MKRKRNIIKELKGSGVKVGDTLVIAKGTKYETKVAILDDPKHKKPTTPMKKINK